MIEEPMTRLMRDETSDELVFEPKPSSYQICLISDVFAEEFEKTLHSIVFLDISYARPILPLDHNIEKRKKRVA